MTTGVIEVPNNMNLHLSDTEATYCTEFSVTKSYDGDAESVHDQVVETSKRILTIIADNRPALTNPVFVGVSLKKRPGTPEGYMGTAGFMVYSTFLPQRDIHHVIQCYDVARVQERIVFDFDNARYLHDCDSCTFLGVIYIGDVRGEAYACTHGKPDENDSIIVRFSSYGPDYCSSPVSCIGPMNDTHLAAAFQMYLRHYKVRASSRMQAKFTFKDGTVLKVGE